jgi:hypothetical protein
MSHNEYDNRHWVIISSDDVPLLDFSEVYETSESTLRYSVDGTLTFVKYDGSMPESVILCPSRSQEYSYSGITTVLLGENWQPLIN